MMAENAKGVIDDFLQNHWHVVLVSGAKISIPFGNNIFMLDDEGFSAHEVFKKNEKFIGIKYYYNALVFDKVELLARLIPEFRKICMRMQRK